MSEQNHPWCRDVARDAAVRRAEDEANWRLLQVGEVIEDGDEYQMNSGEWLSTTFVGQTVRDYSKPYRRRVPSAPQHRDLPEAVAALTRRVEGLEDVADAWRQRCEKEADAGSVTPPREAEPVSRAGVNADGLRTERVTLEVTHVNPRHASALDWPYMVANYFHMIGESVRVVDEHRPGTDMGNGVTVASTGEVLAMCRETEATLTAERDAAIRERDEARAECERLKLLAELRDAEWTVASEVAAKANAESSAKLAPAANAGGEPKQEPVAWGVYGRGVIRDASPVRAEAVEMQDRYACGTTVVPLYAAPQPPRGWLTEEERGFLGSIRDGYALNARASRNVDASIQAQVFEKRVALLEALLARETPPRVQAPEIWPSATVDSRDRDWRTAIREAGVEVTK